MLPYSSVTPKEAVTKSVRVTQQHGSMEGKNILEAVTKISKEKEAKESKRKDAQKHKEEQKEAFYHCVNTCQCEGDCMAAGLKQCPVCHNVLKSVCGKAGCQVAGKKPTKIEVVSKKIKVRRQLIQDDDDEEDDVSSYDDDLEEEMIGSDHDDCNTDNETGESGNLNQGKRVAANGDDEVPIQMVKIGQWVKVKYEGEYFLGKVLKKESTRLLILEISGCARNYAPYICYVHDYRTQKFRTSHILGA